MVTIISLLLWVIDGCARTLVLWSYALHHHRARPEDIEVCMALSPAISAYWADKIHGPSQRV